MFIFTENEAKWLVLLEYTTRQRLGVNTQEDIVTEFNLCELMVKKI